jgi:hypothetical protein
MSIAAALVYVKGLLDGLPMPGGAPAMAGYIDAPDPNPETTIPTAYVWPTDFSGKRIAIPRNTGPGTPAGWKERTHDIDVWITWMDQPGEPDSDTIFPGIVGFTVKALEFAYPMPQILTDPYDGEETQLVNVGEVYRGQIGAWALEDERMLRYDCRLHLPVIEEYQA